MAKNILVVGAGFAGSVCARQLAEGGHRITLIDKRDHIGGNAYDRYNSEGLIIHPYGPHIFHTNDKRVFAYLSRFTDWKFYEHRVLARIGDQLYPIPINRTTLNRLYDVDLETEDQVKEFVSGTWKGGPRFHDAEQEWSSEDHLFNTIGVDLTNKFFRGYTKKQWGRDLNDLPASVAARIPFRTNDDDRYFTDAYQFMPAHGYGPLFSEMLDHPNISLYLETSFDDVRDRNWDHIVYTGPVDALYGYCFGHLPYRSLRFDHKLVNTNYGLYQPAPVVNFPSEEIPYTRITEFKQLTGQKHRFSAICYEYPQGEGDPYYPVPGKQNREMYSRYAEIAVNDRNITLVGRLAQYQYYNMDQVVAAALTAVKRLL